MLWLGKQVDALLAANGALDTAGAPTTSVERESAGDGGLLSELVGSIAESGATLAQTCAFWRRVAAAYH